MKTKKIYKILFFYFVFFFSIINVYGADYYSINNNSIQCINEHGVNIAIENKIGSKIFVPTKTPIELSVFRGNKPSSVFEFTTYWSTGSFGACSSNPTWNSWGSRSSCSVSCGGGTQTRTRACTNTTGNQTRSVTCNLNDGRIQIDSCCTGTKPSTTQSCTQNCIGSSTEIRTCNTHACFSYSWQTGSWGMCTSGTQTRTVSCKRSDGTIVTDSNCSGTKPATSQSCTMPISGVCNNNLRGGCNAGTLNWINNTSICGTTATWLCSGQNGGSNSNTCSFYNGDCAPIYTYSWQTGSWGMCTSGTQTRTVSCKRSDGTTVADSNCSGTKPATSQSCTIPISGVCNNNLRGGCNAGTLNWINNTSICGTTATWLCSGQNGGSNSNTCSLYNGDCPPTYTYSWQTLSWSTCSSSCGGGIQTRTVSCKRSDGVTVADSNCSGTKPATSQTCNTQACPINGVCNNSVKGGCSKGTLSRINNTSSCGTTATWLCSGQNGGSNSNTCSFYNGACATPVDCVGTYTTSCTSCYSPGPASGGSGWYNGTKTCSLTTIVTPASNGGASCPPTKSVSCQVYKNSFIAGTKIKMFDTTLKNIEDIKIGDKVKGSEGINTVLELKFHFHKGQVYSINNTDYFVTPGHPFMTDRGWAAFDEKLAMIINPTLDIKKLEIGDVLHLEYGKVILDTFDSKYMEVQVYNFEVSGTKDYYADLFLVHNK